MYTMSQLDAVRERAKLHGLNIYLSNKACVKFLDWWLPMNKLSMASYEDEIEKLKSLSVDFDSIFDL